MTLYLFQCSINKNDFAITLSASGAGINDEFCCEYDYESEYVNDYIEFPIKFVKSFNTDDTNCKLPLF